MKPTLEEVKKRYPIGTVYKCASKDYHDREYTINSHNFAESNDKDMFYAECCEGCLWYYGQWAEVVYHPNQGFIPGKWYKGKSDNYYFKFDYLKKEKYYNRFYITEEIIDKKYRQIETYWANGDFEKFALENPVDLSEIQEYLPDGHPDKIESKSNNMFNKGDYIVTLEGTFSNTDCGRKNYCFKQKTTYYSILPEVDLSGFTKNGNTEIRFDKTGNLCTDWRYATTEEIEEYNRLGKPFNVTTLSIPTGKPITLVWKDIENTNTLPINTPKNINFVLDEDED